MKKSTHYEEYGNDPLVKEYEATVKAREAEKKKMERIFLKNALGLD